MIKRVYQSKEIISKKVLKIIGQRSSQSFLNKSRKILAKKIIVE